MPVAGKGQSTSFHHGILACARLIAVAFPYKRDPASTCHTVGVSLLIGMCWNAKMVAF